MPIKLRHLREKIIPALQAGILTLTIQWLKTHGKSGFWRYEKFWLNNFLNLTRTSSILPSHFRLEKFDKYNNGEGFMKISDQTLKMINQLPQATRAKVDQIIRTHVAACRRTGSPIENLDRLFIEAVEIVKLEERRPETKLEYSSEWEPFRRYDQYLSPRDL